MENKINAAPPPTEIPLGQSQPQVVKPKEGESGASVPKFQPSPSSELRLVIEPSGGSYVYKTIDRRTGEVVWQYPMEDVLKMRNQESYAAGVVIRTSA
jgi:flagellar protein FlaG